MEFSGTAKFARIDVNKNQDVANIHSVKSIPSIIVFRSGKEVATTIGAQSKDTLTRFITSNIDLRKK